MSREVMRRAFETWVPVRTVSESNQRGHWSARAKRAKQQRNIVGWFLVTATASWPRRPHSPPSSARVTLVRTSRGRLDDDNLRGALKAVRDAVADFFCTHDGPDGPITWDYDQAPGRPGVLIKVEADWG